MIQATRQAFGEALLDLGDRVKNLVVVSCDLSGATRTKAFGQKYPERFFEFGIAEQNAISASAGLAMEGFRPILSSFGAFITARYDQIRISCAYNKAGVLIVGTHAGLAIGKDGGTQMGLEDVTLMSCVPGMQIFQPADSIETSQILEYLAQKNNLAYLRLSRKPQPNVHSMDYSFEFNKGVVLREGRDLSIIASGDMVYHSLEAARKLLEDGIDADVISISTLKPIDPEIILKYANQRKALVTVEDHSIIGGLGSRVCEVISESKVHVPVRRHGVKDCFCESGHPDDLYKKYRLDKDGIAKEVKEFCRMIKSDSPFGDEIVCRH